MNDIQTKIKAVLEVILVYLLIYVILSLLMASSFGEVENVNLKRFSLYLVIVLVPLIILAATRRNFSAYGISFKNFKYHLGVVATCFIPVLLLSIVLSVINWNGWTGALIVSAIEIVLIFVIALILRKTPSNNPGSALLLLMPLIMLSLKIKAGNVASDIVYFYLLVGPGEEILFRGYFQSRLNEAFGRPFTFFGIQLGWGLLIASIIFGFWHVLNPSSFNPFLGSYNLMWPHGLWTVFLGLILGIVREKTGSITSPAILHSIVNYPPQAIFFAFLG